MSLDRVEGVCGQHPPHRVAPTGCAGEANGGAAERVDATVDFELSECRGLIGDHDICGQCQFDAQCEHLAVYGDEQRLGKLSSVDLPRVDSALGRQRCAALNLGGHAGQVKAGGEQRALAVQHRGTQVGVGLVLAERQRQFFEHGLVEGIALGGPVQTDDQDISIAANAQGFVVGH